MTSAHSTSPPSLSALDETSAEVALSCLLLAALVAWADGVVQPEERAQILALAAREKALMPSLDIGRVHAWLAAPPGEDELRQALAVLAEDATAAHQLLHSAAETAAASGGVLGVGAVSQEEAKTLRWLQSLLEPSHPHADPVSSSPLSESLGTLRAILAERMLARQPAPWTTPAGVTTMWPQPCPRFPDQMPPAVFNIPESEYREYHRTIVRRYIQMLASETWDSLRVALSTPPPLDDAQLAELLWTTPFSRFLTPTLDPVDRQVFADVLAELPPEVALYKVDHTHIEHSEALPGVRIAPTLALFSAHIDGLRPLAIRTGQYTARPGAGESWERARLFLLQGCSLALVGGVHSTLHFPADSVIAITREVLPPAHPVAKLITAHAYLQLPLDHGVRWNPRSYAHNSQTELYTAFPMSREGIFRSFSRYYTGVEGNSAYPAYRYPLTPPDIPGPYGRVLRLYYTAVHAFCMQVAAASPAPPLVRWAAALHKLLPGFPPAADIADVDVLGRVLTGFVHSCSIWHALEHHLYSQIPIHHNPHRLRVDPPVGDDLPTQFWQRTRQTDLFRQEIGRRMFYKPHTLRGILAVEHGFQSPVLRAAAADFKKDLRDIERRLPARYRGLDQLACSIQF